MSTQVERLEALLERVRENRGQPRAGAPAQPAAPARFEAAAPAPARPAPPPAPAAARAEPRQADRAKPGATPLEMAFEDQLSGPHAPPQAKPAPQPAPASFKPREAAPSFAQQSSAAAAPREGAMLVDPVVPQPSKPIVQVVSKHPPSVASTFGELLKRSLSLRPR
jgi:hypothetical protein